MKIKREYIVLVVIILALVTYLYFKRTDQLHYAIPQLAAVDEKTVTGLELTVKGETVRLSKKDNAWYIDPKGYPADNSKIEKMLRVIGSLTLTDMVSESKNYARYELGEKDRITVKAYSGPDLSRQFDIGKTASSSRHTFVRLPKNGKVYQARDCFRDDFFLNAAGLRDRKVLSFDQGSIRRVSIASGARTVALTRGETGVSPAEGTGWTDAAGKEVPKQDVDAVITSLYELECAGYIDDLAKDTLRSPELTVTLTGSKGHTLSFYAKLGDRIPATSSGSAYVFTLADYQLESIRKSAEKLLKKP